MGLLEVGQDCPSPDRVNGRLEPSCADEAAFQELNLPAGVIYGMLFS